MRVMFLKFEGIVKGLNLEYCSMKPQRTVLNHGYDEKNKEN